MLERRDHNAILRAMSQIKNTRFPLCLACDAFIFIACLGMLPHHVTLLLSSRPQQTAIGCATSSPPNPCSNLWILTTEQTADGFTFSCSFQNLHGIPLKPKSEI